MLGCAGRRPDRAKPGDLKKKPSIAAPEDRGRANLPLRCNLLACEQPEFAARRGLFWQIAATTAGPAVAGKAFAVAT